MDLKSDYEQILGMIHQLPENQIRKLAITLQSEISEKKSKASITDLILKAPTWTDSDFQNYKAARQSINKSRIA